MADFVIRFENANVAIQRALSFIVSARHVPLTSKEKNSIIEPDVVKVVLPNGKQLSDMISASRVLKQCCAEFFPAVETFDPLGREPRKPEDRYDVDGLRAWLQDMCNRAAALFPEQTEFDAAYVLCQTYSAIRESTGPPDAFQARRFLVLSAYLFAAMCLSALDNFDTLRRQADTETNLRLTLYKQKRDEANGAAQEAVDFETNISTARRFQKELDAADSEITALRQRSTDASGQRMEQLDRESRELQRRILAAEQNRADLDLAKLTLSQYRQINSVRDQYIDAVTSQLKRYNDSQEKYLNQLRSLYVSLTRLANEPEPHTLDVDSDVWKREAGVFAAAMRNTMVDFSTKLARFSEHRLVEFNGLYAKNDLHAKISAMLKYLHDRLDAMLASISQRPAPAYFNPEQSCIPAPSALARPAGTLYCWERATESAVLQAHFRGRAENEVTVFCCDNHRNAIRRVREVTVVGYTMTRGEDQKKVWVLRVRNGF